MKNIYLIGMSGCGKTTVGFRLAKLAGARYVDTDKNVETDSGMAISKIFEKYGEAHFRQLESQALEKASLAKNSVVATGGGIVKDSKNLEYMKNGTVVFIDTPPEVIIERTDFSDRPLIKNDAEKVRKLYNERYEMYRGAADITVSGDQSIEKIATEILKRVKR